MLNHGAVSMFNLVSLMWLQHVWTEPKAVDQDNVTIGQTGNQGEKQQSEYSA